MEYDDVFSSSPADARMLEVSELSIDEAVLTAESVPVTKDTVPLDEDTTAADRKNMIFKGTTVVISTGMDTEIGSISSMVSEADEEKIPLDRKLEQLTKKLIYTTLGLAAAFFLLGWIAGEDLNKY